MKARRLVVVSNRLPIVVRRSGDDWDVEPGAGGLVTALGPVLRDRGGLWIGWPGIAAEELPARDTVSELLATARSVAGYELEPVALSQDEVSGSYEGFANSILWPLFHDFVSRCDFRPEYWSSYASANRRFAAAVRDHTEPEDYVWVHDYHLVLVAKHLRESGVERRTGFFLHIPFPPPDLFLKLPWRRDFLEGMLEYDLIGFQTGRDRSNFIDCVRALRPSARVVGRGAVYSLLVGNRAVRVGAFPISIDFSEFADLAASPDVAREAWILHANLPERKLVLGIDRLDYTKGIPQRLHAFASALERYPELHRKISLVQVVIPSRTEVDEYAALKREIERTVGEINGRFTESGWVPIHYVFRSLGRVELVAHYRTAEIALVTPLKDGMNLVAKEYCASSIEDEGVLILSEFAGAAAQLYQNALIVNPWDIEGTGDAIFRAYSIAADERRARMRRLRASVRRNDIHRWLDSFLGAAGEAGGVESSADELAVPNFWHDAGNREL